MASRNRVIEIDFENHLLSFFYRLETWLTKYDNEMRQKQVQILLDRI